MRSSVSHTSRLINAVALTCGITTRPTHTSHRRRLKYSDTASSLVTRYSISSQYHGKDLGNLIPKPTRPPLVPCCLLFSTCNVFYLHYALTKLFGPSSDGPASMSAVSTAITDESGDLRNMYNWSFKLQEKRIFGQICTPDLLEFFCFRCHHYQCCHDQRRSPSSIVNVYIYLRQRKGARA